MIFFGVLDSKKIIITPRATTSNFTSMTWKKNKKQNCSEKCLRGNPSELYIYLDVYFFFIRNANLNFQEDSVCSYFPFLFINPVRKNWWCTLFHRNYSRHFTSYTGWSGYGTPIHRFPGATLQNILDIRFKSPISLLKKRPILLFFLML